MKDVISVGEAVFRVSLRKRNPISGTRDGYLTIMAPSTCEDGVLFPAQSITVYVGDGNLSELATWLEEHSNDMTKPPKS